MVVHLFCPKDSKSPEGAEVSPTNGETGLRRKGLIGSPFVLFQGLEESRGGGGVPAKLGNRHPPAGASLVVYLKKFAHFIFLLYLCTIFYNNYYETIR